MVKSSAGATKRVQSDVVITGYRLNAKEPAQKALERILGLSPEDARTLARSFPAVVVQGAANDNAERIRAQLVDAGALVELRASGQGRMPRAPLDPPAASAKKKPGMFDLDLEAGSVPPNGPKTGAGLAIPVPPRSAPLPAAPGKPRTPQPTARGLRASIPQQPPPPPAEAYQLGDFGVAPRGQSVVARLPSAPTPNAPRDALAASSLPTLADGNFELDFGGGNDGLELDLGPRKSAPRSVETPSAKADILGERFEELSVPAVHGLLEQAPPLPDVDPQAFRAIHRSRVESRRPAKKPRRLLVRLLDGPLPAVAMLFGVVGISLSAVGYALDPADPIGGLARAQTLPIGAPGDETAHQEGYLHPLLRSTPRAVRAPLAAVLRARVGGVHDVPVSFAVSSGDTAQCTLVEHGTDTEARLAQVRETGHEVAASAGASAELIEHERALRAQLNRPDLIFTRVCLTP
ncbi:MAG TPA: ribosomal protein L7/L12 [Polyangiales bacterium]